MKESQPIANVDLVKQMNSAAVYRLIDQQAPISRIQISEISQLAPGSVTKIIRNLLARGLIKEVEQQQSTGGRRATSIMPETEAFHTLLVQLNQDSCTLALMDLGANLLKKYVQNLPLFEQIEALEQWLLTQINAFLADNRCDTAEVIAFGISISGLVDSRQGLIYSFAHYTFTQPWDLVASLEKQLGLPVFVGHDVRSLALAEHYFGATKDCDDSLLLRIHRGVGAGIVINHEVFSGHKHNVGEIGHIQVDPLGRRCLCGNVGCLETVASNTAIENKMHQLLEEGYQSQWLSLDSYDIEAICNASNHQDSIATDLIEHVGVQIGRVLAMSVNMFNPEKIVISGEITQAKNILFPAIIKTLESHALPQFVKDIPLVASSLEHEEIIGAFALVKRALFDGRLLQRLINMAD